MLVQTCRTIHAMLAAQLLFRSWTGVNKKSKGSTTPKDGVQQEDVYIEIIVVAHYL